MSPALVHDYFGTKREVFLWVSRPGDSGVRAAVAPAAAVGPAAAGASPPGTSPPARSPGPGGGRRALPRLRPRAPQGLRLRDRGPGAPDAEVSRAIDNAPRGTVHRTVLEIVGIAHPTPAQDVAIWGWLRLRRARRQPLGRPGASGSAGRGRPAAPRAPTRPRGLSPAPTVRPRRRRPSARATGLAALETAAARGKPARGRTVGEWATCTIPQTGPATRAKGDRRRIHLNPQLPETGRLGSSSRSAGTTARAYSPPPGRRSSRAQARSPTLGDPDGTPEVVNRSLTGAATSSVAGITWLCPRPLRLPAHRARRREVDRRTQNLVFGTVVLGLLLRRARPDDRLDRAADDRRGPRRVGPPGMGRDLLSAGGDGDGRGRRQVRRPVRGARSSRPGHRAVRVGSATLSGRRQPGCRGAGAPGDRRRRRDGEPRRR